MRAPVLVAFALVATIAAGLVFLFVSAPEAPPGPEERALAWLEQHRRADGSWGSEVYGVMREGHAVTALIACVTGDERALDFIATRLGPDGSLGTTGELKEYPNYATALALRAFVANRPGHAAIPRMIAYLRASQFAEPRWSPEHREYGGWAYSAESRDIQPITYLNISVTSFVVEALVEAGVARNDPVFVRAERFIERCRAGGGWQFTPLVDPLNKAGQGRAYATPAADAAIALEAMGADPTAPRAWLEERFDATRVPGLSDEFADGLRFYWLARAAVALPSRRAVIRRALLECQRSDGSWCNPQGRMREDDPIVATALALAALAAR
jgi:hypothetical protein